jgi:hypothetical protein
LFHRCPISRVEPRDEFGAEQLDRSGERLGRAEAQSDKLASEADTCVATSIAGDYS